MLSHHPPCRRIPSPLSILLLCIFLSSASPTSRPSFNYFLSSSPLAFRGCDPFSLLDRLFHSFQYCLHIQSPSPFILMSRHRLLSPPPHPGRHNTSAQGDKPGFEIPFLQAVLHVWPRRPDHHPQRTVVCCSILLSWSGPQSSCEHHQVGVPTAWVSRWGMSSIYAPSIDEPSHVLHHETDFLPYAYSWSSPKCITSNQHIRCSSIRANPFVIAVWATVYKQFRSSVD